MTTTNATAMIHPFEKKGLGKAPFTYVGIEAQEMSKGQRVIGSVGGCEMTTKPGGTCDYCGTYIVNMFVVESSDGNRFHVGCDCIRKVGGDKLVKLVNADVKKTAKDKMNKRIAEARANLPQAHSLRSQPHPNAHLASEGKNLAHYCEWLFANAGESGQLRATRMVELAIAPVVND